MKSAIALRNWVARMTAAGVLAWLASCGGDSDAPMAPQPARAQLASAPARQFAPAPLTATQLMDWAEQHYPQFFPTAGKTSSDAAPFQYRYYPAADNYLGVSTGVADVAVYVYGNLTNWQLKRLAPLADFTCLVLPLNCGAALSSDIAVYGDSLITPFAENLKLLVPQRTVYYYNGIGETSTQVAARVIADTQRHSWIMVFWAGHNNDTQPEQIKADIAASVASLDPGNTRFVIMAVLNQAVPDEFKGTPKYQVILQLDRELAALYPDNYLDIRSWLVSHYDPNQPQDVIDFGNDVVPSSLRYDEVHLRNEGSLLVARKVQEFIDARGW